MKLFGLFGKKKDKHKKKGRNIFFKKFLENSKDKSLKRSKSTWIFLTILNYAIGIGLSSSILYLKYYSNIKYGINPPLIIAFTAVLISGYFGGLGPAVIATFAASIESFYLFRSTYIPFSIDNPNAVFLVSFIVEGIIAGIILETRIRNNKSLRSRIMQQAVIVQLGHLAITSPNLSWLFTKTSELMVEALNVKYCKILELLPGKKEFILRAGVGWRSGLVGESIVSAEINSQGGYALLSEQPIVVKDLKRETRFYSPELLLSHGVVSGLSVIIPGKRGPFGILGIHSDKKRNFTKDEVYFAQTVANILATAIERKTSEEALRQTQIRFKRLFDSNIIGAFISDFDGVFLEANDEMLNLTGYTRDELEARKIQRDLLIPAQYRYLTDKAVKALKTKGIADLYETEYITRNAKRIPVLVGMSKIDAKSNICVGFVLDISKQKELERKKDEFISIASHELKTPVTSLKVLTQFLKEKLSLANQTEFVKHLTKMDRQVNKLTDLISDLLDISKIQAGKLEFHKEIFNLDELIKEIVDDIQTITTNKIKLQLSLRDAIYADRERIGQVITNFLTNAIKFSPKDGYIVVTGESHDHEVMVNVKDFGVGIDKDYQSSIFEQFFRVDQGTDLTYPGLGMGLFISAEIIKRHQGKIWVESQKGKGATFYFSIPVSEDLYEKN